MENGAENKTDTQIGCSYQEDGKPCPIIIKESFLNFVRTEMNRKTQTMDRKT